MEFCHLELELSSCNKEVAALYSSELFRGRGTQGFPTPEVDFPSLELLKYWNMSFLKNQQLINPYTATTISRFNYTAFLLCCTNHTVPSFRQFPSQSSSLKTEATRCIIYNHDSTFDDPYRKCRPLTHQ